MPFNFPIASKRFIMTTDVMTQLRDYEVQGFLFRIARLCASNPNNKFNEFVVFPKDNAKLYIPEYDTRVHMVILDEYFKLTLNEQKFSVRIPNMYANILEFIDSYTIVEGYNRELFNEVMKFIEDYWIINS